MIEQKLVKRKERRRTQQPAVRGSFVIGAAFAACCDLKSSSSRVRKGPETKEAEHPRIACLVEVSNL